VNKWSNYVEVSKIKVGFITENILNDLSDRDIYDFRQEYNLSGKRFNKSPLTLDPILVLEDKGKRKLKLTNEAMTETKRLQ
jgi:hypothetical protein